MNQTILDLLRLYNHSFETLLSVARLSQEDSCNYSQHLVKVTYLDNEFKVYSYIELLYLALVTSKIEIKNGVWAGAWYKKDYGISWFILDKDQFVEVFGDSLKNLAVNI